MDAQHDEHERIRQLTEENRQLAAQVQELEAELKRLKQLLEGKAESKATKTPVFKENYSLDRNAQRKRKRRGKAATGRRPKEQKREIIASQCDVYPPNANRKACVFHRE